MRDVRNISVGHGSTTGFNVRDSRLGALFLVIAVIFGLIGMPSKAFATTYGAWFSFNVENADVAYSYNDGNGWSSITSLPEDGQLTIDDFDTANELSGNHPGYIVFLVKPKDNYLFTALQSNETSIDGSDVYSIATDPTGAGTQIASYPSLSSLLNDAAAQGYMGYFGYCRPNGGNVGTSSTSRVQHTVRAVQPTMTLSAAVNKSEDVRPGDTLTFTLTATPAREINGVQLTPGTVDLSNIKINGTDVTATPNSDGTYTVTYVATAEDCASGSVTLTADSSVDYTYDMSVKDRYGKTGMVRTTSTIESSASVVCKIADKVQVIYQYVGDRPSTAPAVPVDTGAYYGGGGEEATVQSISPTSITEGIYDWTFNGWKVNDDGDVKQFGSTVTVGTNGLVLVGRWTKTLRAGTVTISKTVTGGAANINDSFSFEVTLKNENAKGMTFGNGDDAISFNENGVATVNLSLKHGERKVLQNVPYGTVVDVTETGLSGSANTKTTVSVNGGDPQTVYQGNGSGSTSTASVEVTLDANAPNPSVAFTNNTDMAPQVGITMNSLPMVALLVAAGAGVSGLVIAERRRNHEE